MNKKRIGIGVGITVLAALTVQAASPVVSNVRTSQRAGTKLVDIWYDVSDADGDTITVSVGVKNGESTVLASSLTGQVGYNISCGLNKKKKGVSKKGVSPIF